MAKMTTSQSLALNGRCVYQVRFFFEPKRRNCIAVLIVLIRSRLEKISGRMILIAPFKRVLSLALEDSS